MSDHDFINAQIRRQIVEATYNAPHCQPPVNLCAGLDGCWVEVFGERHDEPVGFIAANIAYDQARKAADLALGLLWKTLARKAA